jgi:hypothetical protein
MPKKIHKLNEKKDLDFALIGIASTENDYRLSWTLNKTFGLQLSRKENLEVFHKALDGKQEFSQFHYYDDNSLILYRLVSNRSEKGYLLEEMINVDYILQVSGDMDSEITDQLLGKLKALECVTLAFKIDPAGLKSVRKLAL